MRQRECTGNKRVEHVRFFLYSPHLSNADSHGRLCQTGDYLSLVLGQSVLLVLAFLRLLLGSAFLD